MPTALSNESLSRPHESHTPRIDYLHVRKPSLSHSVSSAESSSTSGSPPQRHSRTLEFDPLNLHPTFVAPPRPNFIANSDGHLDDDYDDAREEILRIYFREETPKQPVSFAAPVIQDSTPTRHSMHPGDNEGGDYFMYKLHLIQQQERQQLGATDGVSRLSSPLYEQPKSRWSDSTIDSLDLEVFQDEDEGDADLSADGEEEEEDLHTAIPSDRHIRQAKSWQNFSYKRTPDATTRRPPLTMDGIESFIKRGGWKRRGIVFEQDAIPGNDNMF